MFSYIKTGVFVLPLASSLMPLAKPFVASLFTVNTDVGLAVPIPTFPSALIKTAGLLPADDYPSITVGCLLFVTSLNAVVATYPD